MYRNRRTMRDMKTKTRLHNYRIPDNLYLALKRFSKTEHRTESDVVRTAIARYIRTSPVEVPRGRPVP